MRKQNNEFLIEWDKIISSIKIKTYSEIRENLKKILKFETIEKNWKGIN